MKRLVFAALMMVCSVSWAEWEYTDSSDSFILFHDKSTIRRNGVFVQMWSSKDYFDVQTDVRTPFKSAKYLRKYNCNEETQAIVWLIHYADSLGSGNVTFSYTTKERELAWIPVVPGTIGEAEWKIACSKK
jgi:hypothetical protein